MDTSDAAGRRWGWFLVLIAVAMLVTAGLAVLNFANFGASVNELLPIKGGAKSGPPMTADMWCRAERPHRPFVNLVNEAIAGKALTIEKKFALMTVKDPTQPPQTEPDFSRIAEFVLDREPKRPVSAKGASAMRAAALRLDDYCARAGE